MNRIFKVIYSKSRQMKVVVSEIVKSSQKVSIRNSESLKNFLLSTMCALSFLSFASVDYSMAEDLNSVISNGIILSSSSDRYSGSYSSDNGYPTQVVGHTSYLGYDPTDGKFKVVNRLTSYNPEMRPQYRYSYETKLLSTLTDKQVEMLGLSWNGTGTVTTNKKEFSQDVIIGGSDDSKTLTVKGDTTLNNVTINKNQTVNGSSTVSGASVVGGNSTTKGDSTVNGSQTVDQNQTVKGNSHVNGSQTVDGSSTVTGGQTVTGGSTTDTLHVTGNSTTDGSQTVKGDSTVNGSQTVDQNQTVKGDSHVNGNQTVDGSSTVTGGQTVTGGSTTDTLHVTGNSTIDGSQTVKGDSTVNENLTVNGTSNFNGLTIIGSEKKPANLLVNGNAGVASNFVVGGNISAGGVISAQDAILNGKSINAEIVRLDASIKNNINRISTKVDGVGAAAAALAALTYDDIQEGQKWQIAAGIGNYENKTAYALGAKYHVNRDISFHVGATLGNTRMVNGGFSIALGHATPKVAPVYKEELESLKQAVAVLAKQNQILAEKLNALGADSTKNESSTDVPPAVPVTQ